jgi:hypothetical protein
VTVCLVIPPSPFLLDERVFLSLGILRVAAVLEAASIPVTVCDLSGRFVDEIAAAPPADVYGITVTTPQLPNAVQIIARLRALHPQARILLGGPHVTLTYASTGPRGARGRAQLEALADVLVAGDGERAIFDALRPQAPRVINGDDPKTPLSAVSRSQRPAVAGAASGRPGVLPLHARGPVGDECDCPTGLSVWLSVLRGPFESIIAAGADADDGQHRGRTRASLSDLWVHRVHVL